MCRPLDNQCCFGKEPALFTHEQGHVVVRFARARQAGTVHPLAHTLLGSERSLAEEAQVVHKSPSDN